MLSWLKSAFAGDQADAPPQRREMLRFAGSAAYRGAEARAKKKDALCKVVMLGEPGVGKSAFVTRVTTSRFNNHYCCTIGASFASRTVSLNGQNVTLQLWDTAGQERFQSIGRVYYRGCDGVFLAVDPSRHDCLADVAKWLSEVRTQSPEHVVIALLATKTDLEPVISIDVLEQFAQREGLLFAACSSKTGEGVEDAVIQLASSMLGLTVLPDFGFAWDGIAPSVEDREAKTDSNLLNVDVTSLSDPVATATGDPCMCSNCGVLLNALSSVRAGYGPGERPTGKHDSTLPCVQAPAIVAELQHLEDGTGHAEDLTGGQYRIWDCEFCGRRNFLDLDDDEMPQDNVLDYVVRAASAAEAAPRNVIFCLDISGSMCVSSDVRGVHNVKGGKRQREALNQLGRELGVEVQGQFIPGQSRNATMISRLQCAQAAIEHHIEELALEEGDTKVGLVTFNNEVTVLGDGVSPAVSVTGDRLDSWEELVSLGETLHVDHPIRDTRSTLVEKIWDLQEEGGTALGPALLLSIAMAGKQPGSHVVLCTDGKANIGIGALDQGSEEINLMYTQLAELAKVAGVVVSVVSIIGSECKLDHVGTVATETGGQVERVNPEELVKKTGKLRSLANKPVLAYGAMAMVILHRALQFHGEIDDEGERDNESQNINFLVKDLGNVTEDSELPVSYKFRSREGRDFSKVKSVPFQVQLVYTRPDGTCLLRVATATLDVTNDREVAQKSRWALFAAHAVRRSAELAKAGQLGDADAEAKKAREYLSHTTNEDNSPELEKLRGQLRSLRTALDRAMAQASRLDQLPLSVEQSDEDAVVFQASVNTSLFW